MHFMFVVSGLFRVVHLTLVLTSLYFLLTQISFLWFGIFLFTVYIFPIIAYRIHNLFYPLVPGILKIRKDLYVPWFGAFECQFLFNAVPSLEVLLCAVPGLYSVWLRCWGSKIGKRVMWAPKVTILDRGLLEIGDDFVFGIDCLFSCHFLIPKKNRPGEVTIIVERIRIGNGCFVSAKCSFGPSAVVEDFAFIEYASNLPKNEFLNP